MVELSSLLDGVANGCIEGSDRGLHYGDGLFETLAVRAGRPRFWSQHLARLTAGCIRLAIPAPDPALLRAEADRLCATQTQAVLKIVVTRGSGGRGYRPPLEAVPRRLLSLSPWPDYPASWANSGVQLRYCRTPVATSPALAGLKHLGRLEQVLARAEWDDPAIPEGLMLDADGAVIEGTMSNLFAVQDGALWTPDLSRAGVAGLARQRVLALAQRQGIRVSEGRLTPADLTQADGLFLTNSLIGLWPVRQLEGRIYPIDPLIRQIAEALREEGDG